MHIFWPVICVEDGNKGISFSSLFSFFFFVRIVYVRLPSHLNFIICTCYTYMPHNISIYNSTFNVAAWRKRMRNFIKMTRWHKLTKLIPTIILALLSPIYIFIDKRNCQKKLNGERPMGWGGRGRMGLFEEMRKDELQKC